MIYFALSWLGLGGLRSGAVDNISDGGKGNLVLFSANRGSCRGPEVE